ncbi:MAG: family 43 glycosylhydrolase [Terracoccus sp.]
MRTLHNPVVRGVAPDPSICRVGDDLYLATSTMRFWPGIPIRHSRDLVRLWLACTNVADGQGDFLVSADDAAGEWSDVVRVDDAAFDPSLATGDDGQWLYTRRRLRPDADGFGPIVQAVVDQAVTDPVTGVTDGEPVAITPGRSGYCSNDVEGVPGHPVLTHRRRTGHPIQPVGHADLVEDADGNWWADAERGEAP